MNPTIEAIARKQLAGLRKRHPTEMGLLTMLAMAEDASPAHVADAMLALALEIRRQVAQAGPDARGHQYRHALEQALLRERPGMAELIEAMIAEQP